MILTLLPEEQQILEVKYASKQFKAMSEAERIVSANAVLLKIHAMVGWAFPEPEFARILKDQFIKKMSEGYANVNIDEIEYAFRTYGTTVKDWGKSMNLSLIDEVMTPYLEARKELSRMEEEKKSKKELPPAAPNLSDKAMDDWMEETKDLVQSKKLNVDFIPPMLYEYAVTKKLINPTKEEKWEHFKMAVEWTKMHLRDQTGDREAGTKLKEIAQMEEEKVFKEPWTSIFRSLAKKMLLFSFLKEQP